MQESKSERDSIFQQAQGLALLKTLQGWWAPRASANAKPTAFPFRIRFESDEILEAGCSSSDDRNLHSHALHSAFPPSGEIYAQIAKDAKQQREEKLSIDDAASERKEQDALDPIGSSESNRIPAARFEFEEETVQCYPIGDLSSQSSRVETPSVAEDGRSTRLTWETRVQNDDGARSSCDASIETFLNWSEAPTEPSASWDETQSSAICIDVQSSSGSFHLSQRSGSYRSQKDQGSRDHHSSSFGSGSRNEQPLLPTGEIISEPTGEIISESDCLCSFPPSATLSDAQSDVVPG